jgi:hypothetical protein
MPLPFPRRSLAGALDADREFWSFVKRGSELPDAG